MHSEQLKQALQARGWAQKDLATTLEVTGQAITNWMKGADFPRPDKYGTLLSRGMDVPSPANVPMIVDTGADSTMIDSSVILGLGLTNPSSSTRIFTSTTGAKGEAGDVFDVALTIRREKDILALLKEITA